MSYYIQNMQREDLNPIEEAMGMSKLQKEHEYTQEELASVLGKSTGFHLGSCFAIPTDITNFLYWS